MIILGYVLALLVGLSLGLLGSGGSVLTVPILNYVLGMDAPEAIEPSLVVVGDTPLTQIDVDGIREMTHRLNKIPTPLDLRQGHPGEMVIL